jgi:hypothetical protein
MTKIEAIGIPDTKLCREITEPLRRDQTQARNHFRQCEGRRFGRQGSSVRAGKFLYRDPRISLERLTGTTGVSAPFPTPYARSLK